MTYDEIQQLAQTFIIGYEIEDIFPSLIKITENNINNHVSKKVLFQQTLTANNPSVTLSKTGKIQNVTLPDGCELKKTRLQAPSLTNSEPLFFAQSDDTLFIYPTPSTNYSAYILIDEFLTALTTENQTNWISKQNANVYIYGVLASHGDYVHDSEFQQRYYQKFQTELSLLTPLLTRSESIQSDIPASLNIGASHYGGINYF